MTTTTQIFRLLEGLWRLHRIIPEHGSLLGTAVFKTEGLDKDSLHYREEGTFTSKEGESSHSYREYLYRYSDNKISVFFDREGSRLLHTLEFSGPEPFPRPVFATSTHLCICDTYKATYTFLHPDEFHLDYIVKGPKKDYQMHTIFQRYLPEA